MTRKLCFLATFLVFVSILCSGCETAYERAERELHEIVTSIEMNELKLDLMKTQLEINQSIIDLYK